jgi:hypothetical protein
MSLLIFAQFAQPSRSHSIGDVLYLKLSIAHAARVLSGLIGWAIRRSSDLHRPLPAADVPSLRVTVPPAR